MFGGNIYAASVVSNAVLERATPKSRVNMVAPGLAGRHAQNSVLHQYVMSSTPFTPLLLVVYVRWKLQECFRTVRFHPIYLLCVSAAIRGNIP